MKELWEFLKTCVMALWAGNPELLTTLISTGWELFKKSRETTEEAKCQCQQTSTNQFKVQASGRAKVTIKVSIQSKKCRCRKRSHRGENRE